MVMMFILLADPKHIRRALLVLGMVLAAAAVALVTLCGCAVSLEAARSTPVSGAGVRESDTRCHDLDDRRALWGAIATGAVALSGGSGLSMIPVEDRDTQVALAAGAAGLAAVAVVAQRIEQSATESWVQECSQ